MPSNIKKFSNEFDAQGKQINTFLTNFTLPVKTDLAKIKTMNVVDCKIKTILNRNKLSSGNTLNELLDSVEEARTKDGAEEISNEAINDTSLSMNFGLNIYYIFLSVRFHIVPTLILCAEMLKEL